MSGCFYMKSYTIPDLVFELLGGGINPVGDSHFDREALERLKELIEILKFFHMEIDNIAFKHKDSSLGSCKLLGQEANKYLDWLGISNFQLKDSWKNPKLEVPESGQKILIWTFDDTIEMSTYPENMNFKYWMNPEDLKTDVT